MQPRLAVLLAALCLGSCTAGPHFVKPSDDTEHTLAQLADRLAVSDIVVLGELHDSGIVHRTHFQILRELFERRPQMIVSLEMFERDAQGALSDYLAGKIDEATFLAGARPWPNYKADYRPVIEFCREKKIDVIAANTPRSLAAKANKEGLEAVAGDANVAQSVSAPEDEYYRAFKLEMTDDGKGPAMAEDKLRRLYEAQCLKDDTMAESIARRVQAEEKAGRRPLIVHICGKFHSDHRRGTVERLEQRLPGKEVMVLTVEEVAHPEDGIYAVDGRVGDFVIVVDDTDKKRREAEEQAMKAAMATKAGSNPHQPKANPHEAPKNPHEVATGDAPENRPALGVRPDYAFDGEGLKVEAVTPGGGAEQGGVQEGDLITAIGKDAVTDVQTYMAALSNLSIGKKTEVTVKRGDKTLKLEVVVGSRSQPVPDEQTAKPANPHEAPAANPHDAPADAPTGRPALGIRPDYQSEGDGLRVEAVTPDGGAEKGGVQEGDVITAIGKDAITDVQSYMTALSGLTPGKKVEITVKRAGKEKKLEVVVGTRLQQ